MARAGLTPEWRCLLANDLDPRKGAAYAANWGAKALKVADVASLRAGDLPGRADLAWASFPCQDLSLAGAAAGLNGARSGAFWGFCAAIAALKADGRAPKLIALENVAGVLTSKGGADFAAIAAALQRLGYRYGALTIDAADFLPQSRPRVFVVALRLDHRAPAGLVSPCRPVHHASAALQRAFDRLPPALAADWLWWRAPAPARPNQTLADCLEDPSPGLSRRRKRERRLPSPACGRGWREAPYEGRRLAFANPDRRACRCDVARFPPRRSVRARNRRAAGRRVVPADPSRRGGRHAGSGRGAVRRVCGVLAHARRRVEPTDRDRGSGRRDPNAAHGPARGGPAYGSARQLHPAGTHDRRAASGR